MRVIITTLNRKTGSWIIQQWPTYSNALQSFKFCVKGDKMWELFIFLMLIKWEYLSLQHPPAFQISREKVTNKSRKPVSHSTLFFVWEPNLSQHLYSTAVQKATCKGLSKSGIINSQPEVGIGRPRLTFVLAWVVGANVSADSPLTSATWEKWPQGMHWDANSLWLYKKPY